MAKLQQTYQTQDFYGLGILNNINELNIGTLWRTAYILGAAFIFTVDKKYKPQSSDVTTAWTKIPLYHYRDILELKDNLPYSSKLIGVEITDNARELATYKHPERAVYLLGNEQTGLSKTILHQCHEIIQLPGNYSLNVAVTGSIVAYDRISKSPHVLPARSQYDTNTP